MLKFTSSETIQLTWIRRCKHSRATEVARAALRLRLLIVAIESIRRVMLQGIRIEAGTPMLQRLAIRGTRATSKVQRRLQHGL